MCYPYSLLIVLRRQLRIQIIICIPECFAQRLGYFFGEFVKGSDDIGDVEVIDIEE